jgi:hypothetical protein
MRRIAIAAVMVGAIPALADGTEPKPKVGDYPAQAQAGAVSLGAEYMVHSFAGSKQTFIARGYLVVEVALIAGAGERIELSNGQFALRVNRKTVLMPQAPSFVAASLKYPDWESRPALEAAAGVGNAGVVLGRPQQVERFPGDRRPPQTRLQNPPRAPEQDHGVEKQEPVRADEVVLDTALPEGNVLSPVSGFLYFAYKGKPGSIRSLELIYTGPAGSATVKLR